MEIWQNRSKSSRLISVLSKQNPGMKSQVFIFLTFELYYRWQRFKLILLPDSFWKWSNMRLLICTPLLFSRSEYAEMNISKLHLRIDELEDEIIREKMKINVVCGQLDETFHEMLNKYWKDFNIFVGFLTILNSKITPWDRHVGK